MEKTMREAMAELDACRKTWTAPADLANLRRAMRALRTLGEWALLSPGSSGEPLQTVLGDALSDMMHLARLADIDFDDVHVQAGNRYLEECEQELIGRESGLS